MPLSYKISKNDKLAVAVSGGADSLYSLLNLKKQGYDLIAIHGLFGQNILKDFLKTTGQSINGPDPDAVAEQISAQCAKLDIPFHYIDLTHDFLNEVIQVFVKAYAKGLTPNPCVTCNTRIKFGSLLDKALDLGADKLVTGHYARLLYPDSLYLKESCPDKSFSQYPILVEAEDKTKDQSYFLAHTPLDKLQKTYFPLADMEKTEVLKELKKSNVVPAQGKESQEICFIPGNSYREFLPYMADILKVTLSEAGPMQLKSGEVLGEHKGLWQYTEGQRKGLGIAWKEPLHVLQKDLKNNALILGPRGQMQTKEIICKDINFLAPPEEWPSELLVKSRYRGKPKRAKIEPIDTKNEKHIKLSFLEKEISVAQGQLMVAYSPLCEKRNKPLRAVVSGIIFDIM